MNRSNTVAGMGLQHAILQPTPSSMGTALSPIQSRTSTGSGLSPNQSRTDMGSGPTSNHSHTSMGMETQSNLGLGLQHSQSSMSMQPNSYGMGMGLQPSIQPSNNIFQSSSSMGTRILQPSQPHSGSSGFSSGLLQSSNVGETTPIGWSSNMGGGMPSQSGQATPTGWSSNVGNLQTTTPNVMGWSSSIQPSPNSNVPLTPSSSQMGTTPLVPTSQDKYGAPALGPNPFASFDNSNSLI